MDLFVLHKLPLIHFAKHLLKMIALNVLLAITLMSLKNVLKLILFAKHSIKVTATVNLVLMVILLQGASALLNCTCLIPIAINLMVQHVLNALKDITSMPIKHALKLIDYAKYLRISLTVKSAILDMKSTQMENVRRVKMCSV